MTINNLTKLGNELLKFHQNSDANIFFWVSLYL